MPDAGSQFTREYDLLPHGSTVLCAVSGGADSVCLLHWLSRQKDLTVLCAHFNHQLRGAESDEDEAFVRTLCLQWNIPCYVERGDVAAYAKEHGLSLEEAGRVLRYDFLTRTAQAQDCDVIATAHNSDDNAETVLLNLIRGTGVRGLTGISPRRGNIVRPLLKIPRAHILAYLNERGIPHREDSSNADPVYTRNRLRAQVLPLLRELNPRATEHINATAAQLAGMDRYLDRSVEPYLKQCQTGENRAAIPIAVLHQVPEAFRPHLLLRLSEVLSVGRKDLGAVHLDALLSLKEGGHLDLPHGLTASCEAGLLVFTLTSPPTPEASLLFDRPLSWGNWTLTLLDHPEGPGLALIPVGELTVGPCPPAQRLTLPGSTGARTVKRLCLDRGIGLEERDRLPAFYVDGQLAAVWPIGVDSSFVPKGETIRFIQIKHTEENET